MHNPLIPQGTINRLRGAAVCDAFPALNLTSPFLGKRGISIAWDGASVEYIDTMTGGVTSPAPYIRATITLYLVKTLAPATSYRRQLETSALIGDYTIIPDTSAFPNYDFVNCSIMTNLEQTFDGSMADYPVTVGGYYLINGDLFDQG